MRSADGVIVFEGQGAGLVIPTNRVEGRSGWLTNGSNTHSEYFNVATVSVGPSTKGPRGLPPGQNNTAFWKGILTQPGGVAELRLVDPANFDFRPASDSPLRHAGVVHLPWAPPSPGGGGAPDIGAYQYGEPLWVPGCTLWPQCTLPAP